MKRSKLNGCMAVPGMLLALILNSCQATTPDEELKPDLTGKIKSTRLIHFVGDTIDYIYQYDSNAILSSIYAVYTTSTGIQDGYTITITYETNTVKVVQAEMPIIEDIFYLKPGTNLIDSCDATINGNTFRIYVTRDALNNILNINFCNGLSEIDSLHYSNGILSQYSAEQSLMYEQKQIYHHTFNNTLNKMVNIYPFDLETRYTAIGTFCFISTDVLGISFGNTYTHCLSSTFIEMTTYPYTDETLQYNYTMYSPKKVSMDIISDNYPLRTLINEYN